MMVTVIVADNDGSWWLLYNDGFIRMVNDGSIGNHNLYRSFLERSHMDTMTPKIWRGLWLCAVVDGSSWVFSPTWCLSFLIFFAKRMNQKHVLSGVLIRCYMLLWLCNLPMYVILPSIFLVEPGGTWATGRTGYYRQARNQGSEARCPLGTLFLGSCGDEQLLSKCNLLDVHIKHGLFLPVFWHILAGWFIDSFFWAWVITFVHIQPTMNGWSVMNGHGKDW